MNKHGLLINANVSNNWIGGLYYRKNILFQLLQNQYIRNRYDIWLNVSSENRQDFNCFDNCVKALNIDESSKVKKLISLIRYSLLGIRYRYPVSNTILSNILGISSIYWFPDFQHNIMPEYFSKKEIKGRSKTVKKIIKSKMPLILSSNSAKNDMINYYGIKSNVYIVPFVSYIEPEIRNMTVDSENKILKKFSILKNSYIMIANQYWKHKNHLIVFKAIKELIEGNNANDLTFIFTGKLQDYRHPEYIKELEEYFDDQEFSRIAKNFGFIDREEQIVLMKHSIFVLQPSLFEGWSTVVEDAKVLDKLILLSDIPVHREQMNVNCTLFNPNDPSDLAEKILFMTKKSHDEDIEKGIQDMYLRAVEYSFGFQKLLEDIEMN